MNNSKEENDLLKLDKQLCFRLYSSSRKMTRLYKPLLKALNLTYPQYLVMLVLWDEETINFKLLGEKLELKTGTLTPLLDRLEKLGYLLKEKDKNDDRKTIVIITKNGKLLKNNAVTVPTTLGNQLKLTTEEYKKYIAILDEIAMKLEVAEKKYK
ncbi:MarR family winged helix-turn-helix transcriptional regulator [Helicovermis profundi]|uniref:Organic hydroperoxide resistance transcriptional regulator OhrR n=1 Tax=Helicovermis profundi TaxID=3065157 RepID=A0AAU9EB69_9FIRM|nr:organic hydroperoxide resistance transcriptional regulator OhrR [Clostridia bacterium S502]